MDGEIRLRQYVDSMISKIDRSRSWLASCFRSAENEDEDHRSGFNLANKVSGIHLLEARERYWILRREVEMHIENCQSIFGIMNLSWRYPKASAENSIEDHFKQLLETLKSQITDSKKNVKRQNRAGVGTSKKNPDHLYKIMKLLCYYKIILKNKKRLTLNYEDLNLLWRDMNFVRTRLITDGIIKKDRLTYQLDFCIMEAKSLGLAEDPEILTNITETKEELGVSDGKSESGNDVKARRLIVSLMVKLNDLRIQRLFQQLYKKRMYVLLSFALLMISLILFNLDPLLKAKPTRRASEDSSKSVMAAAAVQTSKAQNVSVSEIKSSSKATGNHGAATKSAALGDSVILKTLFEKPVKFLFIRPFLWMVDKIKSNRLLFIFFGGLTGGIFSMLMKFEPLNKLPGDELYILWYRLTKPLIGAFGAMIIYIIVSSATDSGEIITPELAKMLTDDPRSATGFAVAFISGFTERFLLPKLV